MPRRGEMTGTGACRLLAIITLAVACSTAGAQLPTGPIEPVLTNILAEGQHPYLPALELADQRAALEQLYAAQSGQFLWSRDHELTRSAIDVMSELRAAESAGLRADDYEGNRLTYLAIDLATSSGAGDEQWALFDVGLSAALMAYAHDLHFGRIDPQAAGFKLDVEHSRLELIPLLQGISRAEDVGKRLHDIEPPFLHYDLLKKALVHYRELALEPDLTALPPLPAKSVKPGESYAGAAELRRLLTALGDLPAAAAAGEHTDSTLDAELVQGLKNFQRRNGLDMDGALGGGTFVELTKPLLERAQQIELTLERWRWLPPRPEGPSIFVNIPRFRLLAFKTIEDRESDMLAMNVIVGKSYPSSRTPVFAADMKYIIFRPYWDVPYSITVREMLPAIRNDPAYLARQRLEIVAGYGDNTPALAPTPENLEALAGGKLRLRQQPGPDNALGLVKFMLPNPYNVYLHSTPAQALFERSARAFSHGCVRVVDPVGLAEQILRGDPNWTREKIVQAMNGTRPTQVNLKQPLRVFIVYGTAIANEQGEVYFSPDIYGHDEKLAELLRASRKSTGG